MACGAFRAMLARRSQRRLRFFGYTLFAQNLSLTLLQVLIG
jgi:hypothetical protein